MISLKRPLLYFELIFTTIIVITIVSIQYIFSLSYCILILYFLIVSRIEDLKRLFKGVHNRITQKARKIAKKQQRSNDTQHGKEETDTSGS